MGALAVLVAGTGQASTIGNPAVAGTSVDTCNGCTFLLLQPFPISDVGFSVTSYSLYAYQAGNKITPLIFTLSGGNYLVSGVGTTETIASTGAQTYSFGLTDGSSLVGVATYFGYRDGTVSTGTGTGPANDTIAFSSPGSGALIQYFGSAGYGTSPNIYVGESFNPAGGTTVAGGPEPGGLPYTSQTLPRIYSLDATAATATVPEPGAISLVLGGVFLLCAGRRKRA
jgi:hypothetical protein